MDEAEDKKNDNKAEEEAAELPENELTRCQKERDEYLDGWKRAKADLANYKKDETKRLEFFSRFSQEALIRELINVLDSFDLAIIALGQSQINADQTLRQSSGQAQTNAESQPRNAYEDTLRGKREFAQREKGLYLIRIQLEDILRKSGLERIIVPDSEQFNPALHEAIAEVESDKPAGTIIEEVERGYMLNGKVLRPARVKISK